ncbi:MAG: hypothetical protein KGZ94_02105 [Clostridia bacterium]|nr:hypothetical protein [Clostridia bacterium]
MADTSKLNEITFYILEGLGKDFKTKFKPKRVQIGPGAVEKRFTGVSSDNKIIVHVCHHSGITKGGNIPVGKLNGLYAKCYIMEKVKADEKYIYFTNREFFEIFKKDSHGVIEGIQLRYFDNLPSNYQEVLTEVIKRASDEMI